MRGICNLELKKKIEIDRNTKLILAEKLVNLKLTILPSDMHPAIRSDIGIATNHDIGCDSSLVNVEIMQLRLEQVIKYIFF